MIAKIGTALTAVLGWFGDVVDAIFTAEGALNAVQDLLIVGVALSLAMLGIGVARRFLWGGR